MQLSFLKFPFSNWGVSQFPISYWEQIILTIPNFSSSTPFIKIPHLVCHQLIFHRIAMGWDIPSLMLKQRKERLESIVPLHLKAQKTRIAKRAGFIYSANFTISLMLLLTFPCLYRLATSAVNRLNRVEEGCKKILGFITLLLEDKVL